MSKEKRENRAVDESVDSSSATKPLKFAAKNVFEEVTKSNERFIRLTYEDFQCFYNGAAPREGFLKDKGNHSYWKYSVKLEREYCWIYGLKGKTKPRNPKLHNVLDETTVDNARTTDLVELVEPTFALFHFAKERLYICPNQPGFIAKFLQDKVPTLVGKVKIKNVYISEKEFLELLDVVEEIQLAEAEGTPNLFASNGSSLKNAIQDLTKASSDTAITLSIKARYPIKRILGFLQEAFLQRSSKVYSDLVVKGLDERGLEMVFNKDTISRSLIVHGEPNEDGLYSPQEIENIKRRLLEAIYDKDLR